MKKYYVFVLIDPENNNQPFFVDILEVDESNTSGVRPTLMKIRSLWEYQTEKPDERRQKLFSKYLTPSKDSEEATVRRIFRVVARELADSYQAQLIKNIILISTFEQKTLCGSPVNFSQCFRSYEHIFIKHEAIAGLDLKADQSNGDIFKDDGGHPCGDYYVYALLDPTSEDKEIFYIGKGKGGRVKAHFKDAKKLTAEQKAKKKKEKLEKISKLLAVGNKPNEMTKIIARVKSDAHSKLLETFYMKFSVGAKQLQNATGGKDHALIRAKDDWAERHGFEIVTAKDGEGGRKIKEDLFKGQILDILNDTAGKVVGAARDQLRLELRFADPRIDGAGELVRQAIILTPTGPIVLQIHIRSLHTGKITTLLKPGGDRTGSKARNTPTQVDRLVQLFKDIIPRQSNPEIRGDRWLRVKDKWFNCSSWKDGTGEEALSPEEARNHALLLCKLALSPKSLTQSELDELFPMGAMNDA